MAALAVAALIGPAAVRESVGGYLFALSTLALAVILYLGYASIVLLRTYCPLCLITYAAVIGLFLVSGAATSVPMTSLPRRAARDFRSLVASPLALALAVYFQNGQCLAGVFATQCMANDPHAIPALFLGGSHRGDL